MANVLTVWRLTDSSGRPAHCVISERDRRWQLVVRDGASIVLAERHQTDDAALSRAAEIWKEMKEQGWTEPTH